MIAQQLLRLIQQLSFVYGAGTLVTPPQLLQDLLPCRLTHCFIHSRHGNSHFWHNVSFPLSLTPLPGNKTFGAIRGSADGRFWLVSRGEVVKLVPQSGACGSGASVELKLERFRL